MENQALRILDLLDEAANDSDYGRYVFKSEVTHIIRTVMYGEPILEWRKIKHSRQLQVVDKNPLTDEQKVKVEKTFQRMLEKGVIEYSKSQKMVKPMFTSAEWKKGV